MSLKRIFPLLFAAMFLCSACSPSSEPSGVDVEQVSKPASISTQPPLDDTHLDAADYVAALDKADYHGSEFILAASRGVYYDADNTDETLSGLISPAVATRNQLVEKKYNIHLKILAAGEQTIADQLRAAQQAGMVYADAVVLSMDTMSSCVSQGMLMNLYSVPFLDLDAHYLNANLVDAVTARSTAYLLYSQASMNLDSAYCVFTNTFLAAQEPTTLADWKYLSESACPEVMDKRSPDTAADTFGLAATAEQSDFLAALFCACGVSGFANAPALNSDFITFSAVSEACGALVSSKSVFPLSGKDALKAFQEGRIAYLVSEVSSAYSFASAPFRWKISLLPGLSAESPRVAPLSSSSSGFCVPVVQTDSGRTGRVLNALCAASVGHLEEAAITGYLNFCLNDNASAASLRAVASSLATDFGTVYQNGFPVIASLSYQAMTACAVENDTLSAIQTRFEPEFTQFLRSHFS